ncbi:MAG: hypothetical protein CM15mP103_04730 [Gammaproteobacteria bacterium]|nr:MAG: hypothetical protein CM15mP103_04730 [Gammaproteobacteria bacterium]
MVRGYAPKLTLVWCWPTDYSSHTSHFNPRFRVKLKAGRSASLSQRRRLEWVVRPLFQSAR